MSTGLRPCQYISSETLKELLHVSPTKGKKDLEPLKSYLKERGIPANVVEDMDVHDSPVEVHRHMADFWIALEGTTEFEIGGTLVKPYAKKLTDGTINDLEIRAPSIANGDNVILLPGDWLWVPAGQPHKHGASGASRLLIIKIPEETVPLELIPGWNV